MSGSAQLDMAKVIPILEVAERLGISGLRPAGRERVGPCPVCGGKDRFSINPDMGVFNCRICARGGDQVALVEHVHGCDFKAALSWLVGDAPAAVDPAELERRQKKARAEARRREAYANRARARAIGDARSIWERAQPAEGTLVPDYLAGRGLGDMGPIPPTLRFIANHPYSKSIGGQVRELHRGPCMIAAIQATNGKIRAVHQTWLDPINLGEKAKISYDGEPMPAKMVRGSKKGGSIRLSKALDPLVIVMGEGIETTLTALQANVVEGATYWAGVDLGNMSGRQRRVPGVRSSGLPDLGDDSAFVPPSGTTRLIFIQDGDSAPKATRAKLLSGLRRAICARPGLKAEIVHAGEGRDLNDIIN